LFGFFSFVIASIWQPKPLFKATAKVQINTNQSLSEIYLQAVSYNAGDDIETQQAVITSYPVIQRTAEAMGYLDRADSAEDTTRVVLALEEKVTTSPEGYTNLIVIEATEDNPREARRLVNTLAQVYAAYDFEQKNQQAIKHKKFIADQRNNVLKNLQDAEEAVQAFQEKNNLVSIDAQASASLNQITNGDREIQRLRQDLKVIGTLIEDMEKQGGISDELIKGDDRDRVGENFILYTRQLNDLHKERDAALVKYTENHPDLLEIKAKMTSLRQALEDELYQRKKVTREDLTAVKKRNDSIKAEYKKMPAQGLEYSRLLRQVDLQQGVVVVLEEQYQNALIREADKIEAVSILQYAITPNRPIKLHSPMRRAVLGAILGMILGVVFAVVAETLDTSIGTIEDVQEYTGTQVVGVIPFINIDEVRASLRRRGERVDDEVALQRKAQLVAYFDPLSVLAETYRNLRTNIEFVTVEKGAKTLMITSSMLREGKSTTIANLAMTMAQLGKRTLLVDCDLRKPSVARLFGLEKEPGVTEVIVGNYQWRDVVRTVTDIVTGGMGMEDILQTQGISNLHIITSGSIPPNPAELLNSGRMMDFIAELEAAYDMVLFDAPPILHVTDAAILGKKVDGVLMVYKAGDISRTSLKRSTGMLKTVQIDLLGVVLNGIRSDLSTEFQDMGYSAYYAYGHEGDSPQRSYAEKIEDFIRSLKKRWLPEPQAVAANVPYDGDDEDWQEDFAPSRKSRTLGAVVAAASLFTVAFGLVWQSGALIRPLEVIPVLSGYKGHRAMRLPVEELIPLEADEQNGPADSTQVPTESNGKQAQADSVSAKPAEDTAGLQNEEPSVEPYVTVALAEGEPSVAAEANGNNRADGLGEPVVEEQQFEQELGTALEDLPAVVSDDRPYVIRVSAYPLDSPRAKPMLHRLREHVTGSFLLPFKRGDQPLLRLFVGRFSDWDRALEEGRRLKQMQLIEDFAIQRLPFVIDWGGYNDQQAEQVQRQLEDDGIAAYLQKDAQGDLRILAGTFAEAQEAQAYLASLSYDRTPVVSR